MMPSPFLKDIGPVEIIVYTAVALGFVSLLCFGAYVSFFMWIKP